MRAKFLVFLVCFILLSAGISYSQLISLPPTLDSSYLSIEILAGLVGKYLALLEQYDMMVSNGENPNSAVKVRVAAKLDISNNGSDAGSDVSSILNGISKVAFWVNGSLFLSYPSISLFEISSSFGNIEILTTKDKSIVVSNDESVYAILENDGNLRNVINQTPFNKLSSIPLSIDELNLLVTHLFPNVADFDSQYEGIKPTPRGPAHVIKLESAESGFIMNLWVLDKTWDLYKADVYDAESGSVAVMTFEQIDLITNIPDSQFSIDTSSMAQLEYQDLIGMLGIKLATSILIGSPVVADLYPSVSKVNKGEKIEIISNALDAEEEESDLIPLIECRPFNGSWMTLSAEYVGDSPLGYWKATFVPRASNPIGDYDIRAIYIDKDGNKSDPFEIKKAFKVVAIPPVIVDFSPKADQIPVVSQISITFDQDMDKSSVERAFSATYVNGEVISGVFNWVDKTMIFIPAEPLKYNSVFNVKILGTAKSIDGVSLDGNKNGLAEGSSRDDVSYKFKTEGVLVVSIAQKIRKDSVLKGDLVDFDINIENVTGLSQFSLVLTFDPSILKVSKIERVSFVDWKPRPKDVEEADIWLPIIIDNDKGIARIAVDKTRSGGVSGAGILATVTFEAVGLGETEISFGNSLFVNMLGETLNPVLRGLRLKVYEFLLYDANKDGVVDILDIVTISKGKKDMSIWDRNGDGIVDINDFIAIQADRGIDADVNGDGVVDILDIVYALGGTKGSPSALPLVNELGDSYPNPMNPEVWIPFKLADSGDVVISIYNSRGQLVRTLDLGYRNPGVYTAKSQSAYWDGRDESGEQVSSGLYFYNIKVGNFTATKKMIIVR
ncbi:MAG: Ig-like domain-containing protein [Candidatus Poribacteria bacterium]